MYIPIVKKNALKMLKIIAYFSSIGEQTILKHKSI